MIKFEDGRFYIGSRKSKVPAKEDVDYLGSPGKMNKPLWEMKKEKHILFESSDISYTDLTAKETIFIREGWKRFGKDKCINKNVAGHIDPEVISKSAKEKMSNGTHHFLKMSREEKLARQRKAAVTKSIDFKVRDPNGKIYTAKGIYPFAKKHSLNGASLWEVIRGTRCPNGYKGWTKVED